MRLLLLMTCIYLLLQVSGKDEKVSYKGYQLWKVLNDDRTTLHILQEFKELNYLRIWENNSQYFDAFINSEYKDKVLAELKKNRLKYDISIEDVEKNIEEANSIAEEEYDPRRPHPMSWNYYHRLEDIYGFMDYLHLTYPDLCSLINLGHSYEGIPIKVIKISNGKPNNKAIFIEAGSHANEWITPAAATYVVNKFVDNFDRERPWVQNIDWYVLPVVNPDGYEYTHTVDRLWRKSRAKYDPCIGVDLNRNFNYNFGEEGSSKDPCHDNFKGREPFSEPETAAIERFFFNYRHLKWIGFMSLHSYGQYIVYPGDQNNTLPDVAHINRLAQKAATTIIANGGVPYTTGPLSTTIYSAPGCTMDWARYVRGIKYAFTMELRDTGQYGFLLPPKFIQATGEDVAITLRKIAEAAQFIKL